MATKQNARSTASKAVKPVKAAAKTPAKKAAAPAAKETPAKKAEVKSVATAKKTAAPEKKAAANAPAVNGSAVKSSPKAKVATPVVPDKLPTTKPAPVAKAASVPASKPAKAPTEAKKEAPVPTAAPIKNKANGAVTASSAKSSTAKATTAPKAAPVAKAAAPSPKPIQEEPKAANIAPPPEVKPVVKTKPKEVKPAKPIPMPKITATTSRKYEPDFTRSILDQPSSPINVGPTMRYSDAELQEFRELITRKLEAAKKELSFLHGLITRKDEMSGDDSASRYMTMEDGSLSMEREQLNQMASRQIDFIDKLEKAMIRIENKTYGVCRETGSLIDKARLRAVPHATLSVEAKNKRNNNQVQ